MVKPSSFPRNAETIETTRKIPKTSFSCKWMNIRSAIWDLGLNQQFATVSSCRHRDLIKRTGKNAMDPISLENIDILADWVDEEPALMTIEEVHDWANVDRLCRWGYSGV
ncbi:hypothetical protein CKAN_01519600 [Cinnamomum micranthum f. kanehirae]|uniref:Uncharacterized protein n=1 Tax=Cinnamomum micranthum f. kanehirae TaxID=337451 RepID=A0A443P688_9MAGN|nr:hypothetical protein CKAN_01519600 [Cinnamomum micranthum f. kanehirae]